MALSEIISPIILGPTQNLCELNQFEMLRSVQKFPKIAFYLAVAIVTILFIKVFVYPYLKEKKFYAQIAEVPTNISLQIGLVLIWFLAFTTFDITKEVFNDVVQPICIAFITLLTVLVIYKFIRRRIEKNGTSD